MATIPKDKKGNRPAMDRMRSPSLPSSHDWDRIIKQVREKANQENSKKEEEPGKKTTAPRENATTCHKMMKLFGVSERRTMEFISRKSVQTGPLIKPLNFRSKLHVDNELNTENAVIAASLSALVEI